MTKYANDKIIDISFVFNSTIYNSHLATAHPQYVSEQS